MGALMTLMEGPIWGFAKTFWKPLAIAVAALLVVGYIHHHGFASGVSKTEKKYTIIVTKANAERDSAKAGLAETTAAFEALRVEDARIATQQEAALKAAARTDKATAVRLAQIRADALKGNTELDRARALIAGQARP